MTALIVCGSLAGAWGWFFFRLGQASERIERDVFTYRPARDERTVHGRQARLRLVTPIFDFDSEEPA